jgi:hemolysin activation/secretion protein
LSADNYGYPVSGQYRIGFGAQLTNLFSFGDVISAGGSVAKRPTTMSRRRSG